MPVGSFVAGAVSSVKEKGLKYVGVSVINVVIGQGLLLLLHYALHWNAAVANAVSVCAGALPAYYMSRAWVWGRSDRSHFKTEVLPFWTFVLVGLVFSTSMVALAAHISGTAGPHPADLSPVQKLLPNLVNAASFFILWVLRFFLFEHIFTINPELAEELVGADFAEAVEGHDAVEAAERAQAEQRRQSETP